jgi:hypothetical protein
MEHKERLVKKEVIIDEVKLTVVIGYPEDKKTAGYESAVRSVTSKGSKVDIQQLLSDDQYSTIYEWFELNMNEEVKYEVHYEGRDLDAYGIWKVNEHFYDDIPDFDLTKVTKRGSNRNLLRYYDDTEYFYIHSSIIEQVDKLVS